METETIGLREELWDYFHGGDPELCSWFLVRNNVLPFVLCGIYVLVVKYILPAYMKNREPYRLRKVMIIYNLVVFAVYLVCMSNIYYLFYYLDKKKLCRKGKLSREDGTHAMLSYAWYIYMLKYVEFLDTVFFILRKRYDLVTNLHVIHHGILPILAWLIMRTEKSGYQGLPPMINSTVHVLMYGYYTLAAMGPKYRKYLWWKRYLTLLQMTQFVLIFLLQIVVIPLGGCGQARFTFYVNVIGASVFFLLFLNYYFHAFKATRRLEKKEK